MSVAITRQRLAALSPDDAASLWLVQRDAETPVEAGLFEEWLTSAANREAWEAAERRWALFDGADDPLFADVRAAALAQEVPQWRKRWKPLAVAASLALVVGVGTQLLPSSSTPPQQIAETRLTAPAGSVRSVTLADGSRVTLDSGAQVRVVLARTRRDVAVERGRALFEVAHDTARPFIVAARGRNVTAVGTRFEIALEDGATRVALFEGKVRVDGGGRTPVLLRPGQQLLAREGQPDRLSSTPLQAEALWREGLVEFDDVTLAEAAATINRDSGTRLRVSDPAISQLRISGRFRLREPERFARTVTELLPVRVVQRDKDAIELRAR
jgi:transmembrane sensor